jgi:hypothetical protein
MMVAWSKYGLLVAAVVTAALTGLPSAEAQSRAPTFVPRDESPTDFPPGRGRDESFYACTGCHGFKLVAQQGLSREQWNDSIDWMVKRHNMPPLQTDEQNVVLDYLAAAFPPGTRRRPGGRNPFINQ